MNLAVALELSVLFVCIWGFVAILLTGEFSIAMILLCTTAVIGGYYVRKRGWKPSALAGNLSAIIVFVITLSIFATTLNLLSATLHLFLFLQVTKYITRRELSENRWCYVISLFNVIGASVITTGVVFGPVLVIHVFLMLVSLRLYVTAREIERTKELQLDDNPRGGFLTWYNKPTAAAAAVAATLQQTKTPTRLLASGALLTIVTLGMSAGLFSVIPRLTTQSMLPSYGGAQQDSSVSAFSENVEFGSFTEIHLDERVALFVQPVGENRPDHVRMRGVALDIFDGRAWRRGGGSYSHSGSYDYQPGFTTKLFPHTYTFRVMQPPGISNFLFGDSFPIELRLPRNMPFEVDPLAQSVALLESPMKDFQYEIASMHEDMLLRQDPVDFKPERPRALLYPRTREQRDTTVNDIHEPTSSTEILSFLRSAAEVLQLQQDLTTDIHEPTDPPSEEEVEANKLPPPQIIATPAPIPSESTSPETATEPDNTSASSRHPGWRSRYRENLLHRRRMGRLSGEEILHWYLRRCLELPESLQGGRVGELALQWTQDQDTTFTKAMAIERQLRTTFGYSLTPRARGNYIESFLFDVREGHCEYFATSMAVLLRNIGIPARVVNGFYSNEWNALSGNFTVRQKDAHSWVEVWMGDHYGWMTFDPTPPNGVGRRDNRSAIIQMFSRVSDAVRMRWYRYVIDYSFSDQMQIMRSLLHVRQNILGFLSASNIRGITSDEAKTIEHNGLTIDWRPLGVAGLIIITLVGWQGSRWIGRRRRARLSPVKFYDTLLQLLARKGIHINPGETPQEFAHRIARIRPEWAAFVPLTHYYYLARYQEADDQAGPASSKTTEKKWQGTQMPENLADQYHELSRSLRKSDQKQNRPTSSP